MSKPHLRHITNFPLLRVTEERYYDGKKSLLLDIELLDIKLYQHTSSLEYQVRDYRSLIRHFVLVFCAYTFILWHTKAGGLRRRLASKPLNTFVEALEAFRTAISFRFIEWLNPNRDVFAAYKAALGFVWT